MLFTRTLCAFLREFSPASRPGHTGDVTAVAVAPDGRSLASASWDGTVRFWDLATGQERLAFRNMAPNQIEDPITGNTHGHKGAIAGLAF